MDRRTVTSKANAKKAGQIKLTKKKQQQELINSGQYAVVEENSESSSESDEDNVLVLKKPTKKVTKPIPVPVSVVNNYASKQDIDEIKRMIYKIATKKPRKKTVKIIPTPIPQAAPVVVAPVPTKMDDLTDQIRRKILKFD